ncbi:hypothetical protein P9443_15895 [Peribacillus frigoritolerans]|jgi:hypothetical protein|uniref:hypothetical protein n=1 Tax=Peribacillus frigoritolerans TaxID=450367 RepID=UPI0022807B1C|nr:hypothetical protein [Peribacillus frigoritolerans]MCY9006359.1 hypothetical protein [Peribacillus frigoritolerans]MED4634384.1 hypothetical protein [Peribacillus frigoritolerans]
MSVEKVKRDSFEQVLKDAGNRAMTPGMLSGAFGKRQNGRYMAASMGQCIFTSTVCG